jgi:putative ABC transport system ATP-binding protein
MSEVATRQAPLLRADRLSKIYPDGNVHALRGVSLEVEKSESVAIIGPSGCGKSTLLHLLGGLDRPTEGEVYYRGEPLSLINLDLYRARQIGFVFQSFHLLPTLSAVENIQVPMFESPWSRRARAERAERLIGEVGLSHRRDHRPTRLSVGERQRVAIARALANEPSLLLADEPTGNLDSRSQDEIIRLLEDLRLKKELTLVLITHSPEVADVAGRVIRLRDGEVQQEGASRSHP